MLISSAKESKEKDHPKYRCIFLKQHNEMKTVDGVFREVPSIAEGLLDRNNNNVGEYIKNCKTLVAVTMYNENYLEFHKTMVAINKNFERFIRNGADRRELAVVVIADGIVPFSKNLDEESLSYYEKLFKLNLIFDEFGIDNKLSLEEKIARLSKSKIEISSQDDEVSINNENFQPRNQNNNRPGESVNSLEPNNNILMENMHGSQINRDLRMSQSHQIRTCLSKNNVMAYKQRYHQIAHLFISKILFDSNCKSPLKVYFCIKQDNKKKLNSHLWFFGGFCKVINPKYCVLIDVGTEPKPKSMYLLYEALKNDLQVAGACGEIIPRSETESLFNILVYAQEVEYKLSHIVDKSFESLFGYISVLPGAFSIYRYKSLQPENPEGPLWGDYFKSILNPWLMNCYNSNIYLAEDRVLCLSLFAAEGYDNILKYIPKAEAFTDPPPNYGSLLSQRRRWINGSWFALLDSVKNAHKIMKSKHNCVRKAAFLFQTGYNVVSIFQSFILVALFYSALMLAIKGWVFKESSKTGLENMSIEYAVENILLFTYIILIVVTFLLCIGSRAQDVNMAYWMISVIYSIYMVLFIVILAAIMPTEYKNEKVYPFIGSISIGHIILLIMNDCFFKVCMGIVQLLLMTPTFVNIFTMYSICNIHDCSWGNRPETMNKEDRDRMEDFEKFRTKWVACWAITNLLVATSISSLSEIDSYKDAITVFFIGQSTVIILKLAGAIVFTVKWKFCRKRWNRVKKSNHND
ncbi:hypothetical protein SteCoe_15999 [Stentor coeruleus]|uniref:chitin synthase n=1 Tax=Stentor coeruleus TaxID=5963 RepID=A0A1R2C2I1_9CILI|nr:hypothetical protein SteCoe_15999 [Stentor coeruleus]